VAGRPAAGAAAGVLVLVRVLAEPSRGNVAPSLLPASTTSAAANSFPACCRWSWIPCCAGGR
jgi:hypothetical protein